MKENGDIPMKNLEILIASPPKIDGLRFRKFAGESDFPAMLHIIEAGAIADQEKIRDTLDDLKHAYTHLRNCDPYQDMIIAEINGEPIAYSRVEWWQEEDPQVRVYGYFINLLPEWRSQGIETAVIGWSEARLRDIAAEHPREMPKYFQIGSSESKVWLNEIVESLGFVAERYFVEMSRTLEDIPAAELPAGIEVRPVIKGQERKIWDASCEAFRGHWGNVQPEDHHYQEYASSKYFQPDLWQVAWHGDEVVASVLNYIDHDYNQKNHCLRGWTEDISTQRKWRKRGIATALILRSLHMHKALGMTEVALGVDTKGLSGALDLYLNLGYHIDKTYIWYRKPLA